MPHVLLRCVAACAVALAAVAATVASLQHGPAVVRGLLHSLETECAGYSQSAFVKDTCYILHSTAGTLADAWLACQSDYGGARLAQLRSVSALKALSDANVLQHSATLWVAVKKVTPVTALWVNSYADSSGSAIDSRTFKMPPSVYAAGAASVALRVHNFEMVAQSNSDHNAALCEKRIQHTNRFSNIFHEKAIDAKIGTLIEVNTNRMDCGYQCMKVVRCSAFAHNEKTNRCKMYKENLNNVANVMVEEASSATFFKHDLPSSITCDAMAASSNVSYTSGVSTDRWSTIGTNALFHCPHNQVLLGNPQKTTHTIRCTAAGWDVDVSTIVCTPKCDTPSPPNDQSALSTKATNYVLGDVIRRMCNSGSLYFSQQPFANVKSAQCMNDSQWSVDILVDTCVTPCVPNANIGNVSSATYSTAISVQYSAYATGTQLWVECQSNTTLNDYMATDMTFECLANGAWTNDGEQCLARPRIWSFHAWHVRKWSEWERDKSRPIGAPAALPVIGSNDGLEGIVGWYERMVYIIMTRTNTNRGNVYRVDPANYSVTDLGQLPYAYRRKYSAGVIDPATGIAVVCGGHLDNTLLSSCFRHNVVTHTTGDATPLPTAKRYHAMCMYAGRLYAVGGNSLAVYSADPHATAWRSEPGLPAGKLLSNCAEHRGRLYVCGTPADFSQRSCNAFDGAGWSTTGQLPFPMCCGRLVVSQAVLYMTGGWWNNLEHNTVLKYNDTEDVWSEESVKMAHVMHRHMSIALEH